MTAHPRPVSPALFFSNNQIQALVARLNSAAQAQGTATTAAGTTSS